MDGSFSIVRTLGILRIAFGNKVAKNDARVIGRLVPPLSPLTHEVRGDPILIILCPSWFATCGDMSDNAIERSRERQRRARLPLSGTVLLQKRNVSD